MSIPQRPEPVAAQAELTDLGVGVEPQGAGDAVEDLVGGVLVTALLEAQVVLRAGVGEQRGLP
jgi:hypothetical protein